jgi:hypothetical protein
MKKGSPMLPILKSKRLRISSRKNLVKGREICSENKGFLKNLAAHSNIMKALKIIIKTKS